MIFILTLLAALGCALNSGIFFAFSTFVMKALSKLPPAQGIAAMQSINITVLNRFFFAAFFGTAVVCILLAGYSLFIWERPEAIYLLAGGLLYLIGTILVTIMFNVPRNNVLASLDPSSVDAPRIWANYVTGWTIWNHVRTIAAFAAAALLTIALCLDQNR
jgi:uncharacterized membrane protein